MNDPGTTPVGWPKQAHEFVGFILNDGSKEADRIRNYCDYQYARYDGRCSDYSEPEDLFFRVIERIYLTSKLFDSSEDGVRFAMKVATNLLRDEKRRIRRNVAKLRGAALSGRSSDSPSEIESDAAPESLENVASESLECLGRLLSKAFLVLNDREYAAIHARGDWIPAEIHRRVFSNEPRSEVAREKATRRQQFKRACEKLEKVCSGEFIPVRDLFFRLFKGNRRKP